MIGDEDFLARVVNEFGAVRGITVDDLDPVTLSVVNIRFEAGVMRIAAIETDDTVAISEQVDTEAAQYDATELRPWTSLVGGHPMWIWILTNQQGYTDGVQIHVRRATGDSILQLLAVASSLKPHTVNEEW